MEKEKKFVSLVVYLHNSEAVVNQFFSTVVKAVADKFTQYEIVCVDDACDDKTMELLPECLSAHKADAMVNIVHMSYYQGLEASMNAGRDIAIGDFVFEFDSCVVDYDVEVLYRMYEKLLEGYDIVSAVSDSHKRLSSKLFYKMYNSSLRENSGEVGPDNMRIISRRAINRVKSMGVYIPYRKAVYANCGLKTYHLKYNTILTNKKHYNTSERINLAFDSFIYYTDVLEKLSRNLSILFLLTTVGIGIYILDDIVFHHNTADGWLSIMGFLSVGFFGLFLLLTVVLKYLTAIINLTFKQRRYVVSDIEKIAPKGIAD
ncbi:MAG: glycosyltransferase [Lachnospiraceae bacterium]|nr:glycosyltransferase [Lachnospiraceae bacterium]